jgi:RNA-splicing ligase RtcB
VEEILDEKTAKSFGLKKTKSWFLFTQVLAASAIKPVQTTIQKMEKVYGFSHLPDRELACAPIESDLGKITWQRWLQPQTSHLPTAR